MTIFNRRFLVSTAFSSLILALVAGCATVPITGRRQLNLISPSQEMDLGLSSFESMKKEVPVSRDAAANALVQKVGQRIAAVAGSDLPNAKWEFVVFQSEEANAFCLPGGKVGVYTGLLPIAKDEAGLATVIGHEVAHAAAHHGAERMSEAMVMQTGSQFLGATLNTADPKWQTAANTAYGVGAQLLRALPHSREQESEADHMGLMYMAKAGYDPEAALQFWARFSQAGGSGKGLWFLRTHPLSQDRIDNLRKLMPQAKTLYRPSR